MFGKKKDAAAPATAAPPKDDLGPYPEKVSNNISEQASTLRALRAVSLVAITSGLLNVGLGMLLVTIMPLQKVQPYLVTFKDQENQVVAIEPLAVEGPASQFMAESDVRDYVVSRHRFVPINSTMEALRGPESRLALRTEKAQYDKFRQASAPEMAKLMELGYTRTVEIESAAQLDPTTWQVQFRTLDALPGNGGTLMPDPNLVIPGATPGTASGATVPGGAPIPGAALSSGPSVQSWTATMRISYEPQEVVYNQRLLNPLGFKVQEYAVVARN